MRDTPLMERVLSRDRLLLVVLLFLLFLLASLYTVFGVGMRMTAVEMTAMRGMRDMPGMVTPGSWSAGYAMLVFLMWWVMMGAMMLPSVAPTVLLNAALLRHAGKGAAVSATSALFLSGYLAVWAGFSIVAAGAQWVLEGGGLVSATMMTLTDTLAGGVVLILAGVFQFTPLKAACLTQCRSPIRFLTERRRPGLSGAFGMGVEHGTYCLGCCWILMALLFVGGIMNLYWIVGLAAFVGLEKLLPWGDRFARLAGAGLIVWGSVISVQSGWAFS